MACAMVIRVDIANGNEEYYKLLEVKRAKSKRLGYGDDSDNWELKEYENQRRNLKKMERMGIDEKILKERLNVLERLKNLIEN